MWPSVKPQGFALCSTGCPCRHSHAVSFVHHWKPLNLKHSAEPLPLGLQAQLHCLLTHKMPLFLNLTSHQRQTHFTFSPQHFFLIDKESRDLTQLTLTFTYPLNIRGRFSANIVLTDLSLTSRQPRYERNQKSFMILPPETFRQLTL